MCGYRQGIRAAVRIIRGRDAGAGEYPWQVMQTSIIVHLEQKSFNGFFAVARGSTKVQNEI